jgi:hypothetical protein
MTYWHPRVFCPLLYWKAEGEADFVVVTVVVVTNQLPRRRGKYAGKHVCALTVVC